LLGEHNESILKSYLGYTDERISELAQSGVLHSKPY
ncbi:MAG: hypothetical protein QOF74_8239, partial [Caballeronia mineralivorans]|nr:hypothetical protein [Caballeronia mineralivorans]